MVSLSKVGFMEKPIIFATVSFTMFIHIMALVLAVGVSIQLVFSVSFSFELVPIILLCMAAAMGFGFYAVKSACWPSIKYTATRLSIALTLSFVAIPHALLHDLNADIFIQMNFLGESAATFFVGAAGCALFLFNKTRLQYMVFWPPVFVVIALIYWDTYFLPYLPY